MQTQVGKRTDQDLKANKKLATALCGTYNNFDFAQPFWKYTIGF